MELGLPIGGWVPRGRSAEDGLVPARYARLREADSADYAVRTRLNVQDADATLVLRMGIATGGTRATLDAARRLQRPLLDIDLERQDAAVAAAAVSSWLEGLCATRSSIRINVAGPRASQAPMVYSLAREALHLALASYSNA
jgi:hypothetical protein